MTFEASWRAPATDGQILPGVADIAETLQYLVYLLREDAEDAAAVQSHLVDLDERLAALSLLLHPGRA